MGLFKNMKKRSINKRYDKAENSPEFYTIRQYNHPIHYSGYDDFNVKYHKQYLLLTENGVIMPDTMVYVHYLNSNRNVIYMSGILVISDNDYTQGQITIVNEKAGVEVIKVKDIIYISSDYFHSGNDSLNIKMIDYYNLSVYIDDTLRCVIYPFDMIHLTLLAMTGLYNGRYASVDMILPRYNISASTKNGTHANDNIYIFNSHIHWSGSRIFLDHEYRILNISVVKEVFWPNITRQCIDMKMEGLTDVL